MKIEKGSFGLLMIHPWGNAPGAASIERCGITDRYRINVNVSGEWNSEKNIKKTLKKISDAIDQLSKYKE